MSTVPNIPDFLIAKGIRPGGVRLPKRPKIEPAYLFKPLIEQNKFGFGGTVFRDALNGDKLTHGDLRYWVGSEPPSSPAYGACRNCGEVQVTGKERKAHSREKGCGRLITEAFKALLRDRKCVICDQFTHKSAWGVPLCSAECIREWSYVTRCPSALHQAFDVVRATVKLT